jgi:predicted ferric reductase
MKAADSYKIAWTVHDSLFNGGTTCDTAGGSIDIQVAWKATGWGALGFGPSPNPDDGLLDHTNTDFYAGSSTTPPQNSHSTERNWPTKLGSQAGISNTATEFVDGWFIMSFTRPLRARSSSNHPVACNAVTTCVWAYALTNTNLRDGARHTTNTKGVLSINFYKDPSISPFSSPASDPICTEFGNCVPLDPNYRLYWRYNPGTGINDASLDIAIQAYTTGWVVIGFEPNDQSHQNTDMVYGYISGSTQTVSDLWSTSFATPSVDPQQNIYSTSVSEVSMFTVVRFSRKLVSTDKANDKDIGSGPRKVVWGYGAADPSSPSTPVAHSSNAKGLVMIDWMNPPGIQTTIPAAPAGPGDVNLVSITDITQILGNYPIYVPLDSKLDMHWAIDTSASIIKILLRGKGFQGWASISMQCSSHGHMNSDIIMGNAVGNVADYFSNAITSPVLDTSKDLKTYSCAYLNGDTIVTFERSLSTPDTAQDRPILTGLQNFAWAYQTSDVKLTSKHSATSGKQPLQINWYSGEIITPSGAPLVYQTLFFFIPAIVILFYQKLIFFRSFSFLFIFRKPLTFTFLGNKYNYTVTDAVVIVCWAMLNVVWTTTYAYTQFGKWNIIGLSLQFHCALLLLPILRNSIFEPIFGISFDRAIKYHRWLGYSTCLILIMHAGGNWADWKKTGVFGEKSVEKEMVYGEMAFVCALIMVLFAVSFWRRQFFESFLVTHMLYPIFILFAALHSKATPNALGWYFFPSVMLFIIDRLIRAYRSYKPTAVTEIAHVNGLTRLQLKKPAGMKYEGGQYLFIMIPSISKIEWHPFSIASAPQDEDLMLCIRDAGGWTHKLLEAAKQNITDLQPHVDGPYGRPAVDPLRFKVVMLISGGVGAVPWISVVRELLHRIKSGEKLKIEKLIFVWSVRSENNWEWFRDTFREIATNEVASKIIEFRVYGSNIGRSWTPPPTMKERVLKLFGLLPHVQANKEAAEKKVDKKVEMASMASSVPPPPPASDELPEPWTEHFDEASGKPYYHNSNTGESTWTRPVITRPPVQNFRRTLNLSSPAATAASEDQSSALGKPKFIEGRPNVRDLFNEVIEKYPHCDKFAVMVCGPMGMVYDARELCFQFSETRKKLFHFHSETFEF